MRFEDLLGQTLIGHTESFFVVENERGRTCWRPALIGIEVAEYRLFAHTKREPYLNDNMKILIVEIRYEGTTWCLRLKENDSNYLEISHNKYFDIRRVG